MNQSGVIASTALRLISSARDLLNNLEPPKGDLEPSLAMLENPPIDAQSACKTLQAAQQQLNDIYKEACVEAEGLVWNDRGGHYQHEHFQSQQYHQQNQSGRGRQGRNGWGGRHEQGRGRGNFGGRSRGTNSFKGQAAAPAPSLPAPRVDFSWVRSATQHVRGRNDSGKSILELIDNLQAAIQLEASEKHAIITEHQGKFAALSQVLSRMWDVHTNLLWVEYDLATTSTVSDQTFSSLMQAMSQFVSQVGDLLAMFPGSCNHHLLSILPVDIVYTVELS